MAEGSGSRREALRRQQNFESITFSYLKRHFFDSAALQKRTMEELVRAVRTGRLIAFTGSMTTEDRGYVKWRDFVAECFKAATQAFNSYEAAAPERVGKLREIVEMFKDAGRRPDDRVSFSVIGETVDLAASYSWAGASHVNPNEVIAKDLFLKRHDDWRPEGRTILEALLRDLNVDRTITLNYDLEVELEYSHRENPVVGEKGDKLSAIKVLGDHHHDEVTGMIVKRLPGARSMVSDVFNRERTDRLFEFAIGSADHEYHVLHLHGRADAFDSMVVSYRDYDRLYRRSGLSKAPFEHALKLLFAGNPILFVGIGMNEQEVNQALQDFVGDNPYRRITPTFLLWNSFEEKEFKNGSPVIDQKACDVFRIDMLHRLGVLTIFSHELAPNQRELTDRRPDENADVVRLKRLRRSIANLADRLAEKRAERQRSIKAWRSMSKRVKLRGNRGLIGTWQLADDDCDALLPTLAGREFLDKLTLVAARSGLGKGRQARAVANSWRKEHPSGTVLLLNADFCFDTDSLLNLVGDFLKERKYVRAQPSRMSRNRVFRQPGVFSHEANQPVLIITNGVERLFGNNGEPLSAEFDEMLRHFARALERGEVQNFGMVMFSTPRTKSYFNGIFRLGKSDIPVRLEVVELEDSEVHSQYIKCLEGKLMLKNRTGVSKLIVDEKSPKSKDLTSYRRAFYAAILEPRHLEAIDESFSSGRLALDTLTVMAQIGQPVEADVLFLAPRIQRRLRQRYEDADGRNGMDFANSAGRRERVDELKRGEFSSVLAWLQQRGLILPLEPFSESLHPAPPMPRYGLHSTLLSEIRERSGVPLSEAVLSTAFNMSLYTAQPADGPLPEPSLHDELGRLIDWMIGAWKDDPFNPRMAEHWSHSPARPDAIAALRAALAIVRGFYSTTTLLSLDGKDRISDSDRDGALTEHAERLERLLAAFRNCTLTMEREKTKNFRTAGPFYADEIVWLHNEIGVVKLAQGSLYEARFAFEEADRFNREFVEFDDRTHNWRRIALNQVLVDIERARLDSAERLIKQIEEGFDEDKCEAISEIANGSGPMPMPSRPDVSHEEILAMGLIHGYRGICAHISGKLLDAREHYDYALDILRRIDERRALATFQRHRAALMRDLEDENAIDKELGRAIASAEAVRQMDLVHHGRIQRASKAFAGRDIDAWARASRQLHEALVYADSTDMYRIRVEARANLAMASMVSGDFEVALEHATDAMTVAVRHGLSLRKASLRVLIGQILVMRGDPQSGKALIESGKAAAGRIGYQGAVSRAQAALTMGSAV